ncbi:hypothetical protein TRFO_06542 [Tritrichomonas foetus]|uniref:Uncharacterized protein n=1 Tax=Tritrichomonas foetus TaxID=1144522 RepID=A0A1J4K1V2_9EUKA|nr:hypothetical protein TRFO_06542 [Tritrichomonas foetus]|eukprot:OHT03716.1 hypothetical protein TRFO_06542 [Tritrichomonas foetus]
MMEPTQNRHQNQTLKPPHTLDNVNPECHENPEVQSFFRRVIESQEFCMVQSEGQQVAIVKDRAEREGIEGISYQVMADFFTISSKSTIKHHLDRWVDEDVELTLGARRLLTNQQKDEVIWLVNELQRNNNPETFEDIRDHLLRRFNVLIPTANLRHYISYSKEFKSINGVPKEYCRVFYKEDEVDAFFNELEEIIAVGQIPGEKVFNIDEVGHQEFVDAHVRRVVVSSNFTGNEINIHVRRNSKRSTMLAGVSANGSMLKPLVIVERSTIEKKLLDAGYTAERLIVDHSNTGFITTKNFSIGHILFSNI